MIRRNGMPSPVSERNRELLSFHRQHRLLWYLVIATGAVGTFVTGDYSETV